MPSRYKPASLFKRLSVIGYDAFLLTAILFIATAITLPLNHGEAIRQGHPYYPFFIIYLFIIAFIFFGWFWTHGGQTLGMKTWKLKLISANGSAVTWKQAFIRFVCAIISVAAFGLGFLWSVFNEKKATLHDIFSDTILIDLDQ